MELDEEQKTAPKEPSGNNGALVGIIIIVIILGFGAWYIIQTLSK